MVTVRISSVVWFCTGAIVAVIVTLLFVDAWRAEAAPGDADTTFVPITPGCRFADTRQAGQGPAIGPKQVRTFTAHGTHNACTIPNDAVGLLMNVTVDGRTAPNSFLTVWGNGGNPGTSALNPAAGEPPTPNAVTTDLTPSGQFKIYNDAGFVHVIIDINGYYTTTSLTQLHQRIATLEAKLASVSTTTVGGHPTVRFTGVNVQIVNGSGKSQCAGSFDPCNGRGNLIVGYSEGFGDEARSGSHNIVGGALNDWTSYGGIVGGNNNTISGSAATAFGLDNTASGQGSSVTGGQQNRATAFGSSVSGGDGNRATGVRSSVSGGRGNQAGGEASSLSGGQNNAANGYRSWAAGGNANFANGPRSSVSGGDSNVASGESASVSGGWQNLASGQQSSVIGGRENWATGTRVTILGGASCIENAGNGIFYGNPGGTACPKLN